MNKSELIKNIRFYLNDFEKSLFPWCHKDYVVSRYFSKLQLLDIYYDILQRQKKYNTMIYRPIFFVH